MAYRSTFGSLKKLIAFVSTSKSEEKLPLEKYIPLSSLKSPDFKIVKIKFVFLNWNCLFISNKTIFLNFNFFNKPLIESCSNFGIIIVIFLFIFFNVWSFRWSGWLWLI